MIRNRVLNIAVTEDEYQLVRRAAFEEEKTISTLLYDQVLQPALREKSLFLALQSEKVNGTSDKVTEAV